MLNSIKIGPKLIGGFVIVALIAAGMALFAMQKIKAADDADSLLYEKGCAPFEHIVAMVGDYQRMRLATRDLLRTADKTKKESVYQDIEALQASFMKDRDSIASTLLTEKGKEILKSIDENWKSYSRNMDSFQKFALEGKDAEATALLDGTMHESSAELNKNITDLVATKLKASREISDQNSANATSTINTMMAILIIGVIIALLIGISLTLSITRPLIKGVAMMQELAKGHLGMRLKMDRSDEVGMLAKAMDDFTEDLQKNVVAGLQKVSVGDLTVEIAPKDAQDEIGPALKKVVQSLRDLVAEAGMLRKAAIEGRLATRGNAANFGGGYKEIVSGVNDTLDAVINPLNVTAK